MANTRTNNVIRVDTTAAFAGPLKIKSVKYIGASSGTALITEGSSGSGNRIWESKGGDILEWNEGLCTHCGQGFHVAVTNNAVVYIYLD